MSLISNAHLQIILDKTARFAATAVGAPELANNLNAGFAAAHAAVLTGTNSIETFLLTTGNSDAIADILPAARDLEELPPVPPSRFIFGIVGIANLLKGIDAHLKRYAGAASLDAYLTGLNAGTPTLRVHQSFEDHLKNLGRGNVFIGSDTVLATLTVTGAAAGTFLSIATITAYAGAQLVVKNQGAVTAGATISVTGKKLDNTTQVMTATVSTGTDNIETNLSSVLKLFTQVTAITITGATVGNVYKIVAKTDRDISAA